MYKLIFSYFFDRINRIYMIVFSACASHADRHPVERFV
jgi:hypothetical protein